MKPILFLLLALSAPAQTYTTNWVLPGPNYRMVTGRVYDVRGPGWVSMVLPRASYSISKPGRSSEFPAPGERADLFAHSILTHVYHFPYNPNEWDGDKPKPYTYRLFLLSSTTNWGQGGKITFVSKAYDFGLPATNKIPVITKTPP